jgi:predicted DNA-binding protein YlxM (UPF0122 family)
MQDSYTIFNTIKRTGYAYSHLGKDDREFRPKQALSRNTLEEEVIDKINAVQKITRILANTTETQKIIIYYLADDLTNDEIAKKMKISRRILDNNIRTIRKKAKRLKN